MMTTAVESHAGSARAESAVPAPLSALGRLLVAADHVRIGAAMLTAGAIWAVVAAVVGAVLGVERLDAGGALVDAGALTQLFSLHRFALVVGVAAPLALGASVLVLPAQLHASNVSLPRLAAFGWWAWFAGSVTAFASYLATAARAGETSASSKSGCSVWVCASSGCVPSRSAWPPRCSRAATANDSPRCPSAHSPR